MAHPDFHPKKRFGQSFLIDMNIVRKIINSSELKKDDIAFNLDGTKDEKIQVKEILEVSDDHSQLKVRLAIDKDAVTGKRNVFVKTGLGKNIFEIKRFFCTF